MPTSMTSSSAVRRLPRPSRWDRPQCIDAAEQGQQRGQHDERVRDAVDAEMQAQIQARYPRQVEVVPWAQRPGAPGRAVPPQRHGGDQGQRGGGRTPRSRPARSARSGQSRRTPARPARAARARRPATSSSRTDHDDSGQADQQRAAEHGGGRPGQRRPVPAGQHPARPRAPRPVASTAPSTRDSSARRVSAASRAHRADDQRPLHLVEVERAGEDGRRPPERPGRVGGRVAAARRPRPAPRRPPDRPAAPGSRHRGAPAGRAPNRCANAGPQPDEPEQRSPVPRAARPGRAAGRRGRAAPSSPRLVPKNTRSHRRVAYHAVTSAVASPASQTSQPTQPATGPPSRAVEGRREYRVLAPEPGERRYPGERGQPDREAPEGHRQYPAQPAHQRHGVAAHRVDHAARGEEQQRLEARRG